MSDIIPGNWFGLRGVKFSEQKKRYNKQILSLSSSWLKESE